MNELATLSFTANATDGNSGDTLTFSLVGAPTGASINFASGAFAWMPTEGQDGNHTITVQVHDSANASDSEPVTVIVNEVNMPPELALIGPQSVNRPSQLTFTALASDDDVINGTANTLTFSLGTGAPNGAYINSTTGAFAWTPTADQVRSHTVKIQVNDGNNGSDFEDVSITVTESNVAPMLETIGAQSGDELSQITFIANATDGNSGDTLTFSLVGAPTGASINFASGAFAWMPTEGQDGNHTITVQVHDSANASDSEPVTVIVNEVNMPPELALIGPQSVNRPSQLTFTALASDDDVINGTANTLTFSLGTGAPNAYINSTTGAFAWTPTADQVRSHTVKVQVNDGNNGSDFEDVSITVTESNVAPMLETIGAQSGDELSQITFIANATDGNSGDTLTFSLVGAPTGASINFASGAFAWTGAYINSTTGAFAWTPTADQVRSHTVKVQVNDGNNGSDFEDVSITVTESNVAPMLETIGAQSGDELSQITFIANATDGNSGDTLTFSLVGAPTGASINFASGAFAWMPTEGQDGNHTITVQVHDSANASDSEPVTVIVNEVNMPPELALIGPQSVNRPSQLTFTALASDDDVINGTANTLTFSLGTGAPNGAYINSTTGAFAWTPTADQVRSHTVKVQVNDGNNGSDFEDVSITVTESNVAPMLETIGAQSGDELSQITFIANATDGNSGDTLTFSLVGAPTGASINFASGAFAWMPTEGQDGNHTITVQVHDSANASDSEPVTVIVNEVNMPPELALIGPQSVNRPSQLTFTALASDDDVINGTANTLTFSLGTGAPNGAYINSTTGAFAWTPTADQVRSHTVKVQVNDGNNGSDFEDVSITVTESNVAPMLETIGAQSGDELSQITFIANATDGNSGDTLTFSLVGAPTGASINFASGAFAWMPTEGQDGNHTITVQVHDSANASDSEPVTVIVNEVNMPPELALIGPQSVNRPSQLTFTALASDDDVINGTANTLTFSLGTGAPNGAYINSTTGAFAWTPTADQVRSHTVKVQVNDGNNGSDFEDVSITVTESNVAPMLETIGAQSGDELSQITFIANATDGNSGDTLTFSLVGAPTGASINFASGAFAWMPTEGQDGNHTITVQVHDSANASDSEPVTVIVNEVNMPPELALIGPQSVNRPSQLTFTALASDDDVINGTANTLTFSLGTGAPNGAYINSTTGAFAWTPTADQVRSHTVKVQVNDGNNGSDFEDVSITVTESNVAPMLETIGAQSGDELSQITFIANATDGNSGDTLTFSLVGAPTGASINFASGAFAWMPTEGQDGNHTITVQVHDSANASDSEPVTVIVNEVNMPPELALIGPQSVNRPSQLTFTALASDDDVINGTANTLTFSLGTGAPNGAYINSTTGAFAWTPTADQVRSHTVKVQVNDGNNGSDFEDVSITVTESNVAPMLETIGAQSGDELSQITFIANATDGNSGDTLTFSLVGAPTGASINFASGAFSWTPDQSQDGDYSITVRVSDGRGGTDSEVVTVRVHDIAPLPVSARASSSSAIALTLSETVTSEGQGSNGFEVMMEGDPVSVESITGSGTTTLTLNLDGTISASDGVVRLSYSDATGDVADENGNPLASFSDLDVLFPSQRRGGTTPPAVDLGTLAYQRSVDIPPHIAEQIASHDASEPLEPITPDGTFDFPLVINGYGYLLDDTTNTLVPQIVTVGDGPTIITLTVYTQKDLAYFTLYLNLQGENTNYVNSDTYITYKNDDGTTDVTDPHGYIGSATVTVTQEDDSVPERKTVRITVEFGEEPMGSTNMVAYMWNTDRKATFIKIIDAIGVAAALLEPVVQAADPEPLEPDSELPADPEPVVPDLAGDAADPEPVSSDVLWPADDYDEAQVLTLIRMWSGFESEMITDTQLLELLGLEDYQDVDLPDWMMTELGVLVAKGDVTVGEFVLALQYVLENL